ILSGEEKHLRHYKIRDVVVDRRSKKDDIFFEQPRIDIVGTFSSRRLLDHHGHEYRIIHPKLLCSLKCERIHKKNLVKPHDKGWESGPRRNRTNSYHPLTV